MLFNAYLDFVIQSNPKLKSLADKGSLLAFSDDMLIIAKDKHEAEETLRAFAEIQEFGFKINLKKTQIMTDRHDMQDVVEICDVKITKSIKYLGITIYCDRKLTSDSIKG